MRKSLTSLLVAGLIAGFSFTCALAWAGPAAQIPNHLQKRVLVVCQEAAAKGQIQPVTRVDRQTLLSLVNAPCPRVRITAIYTLGEIRETGAVEPLVAMLDQPDAHVRRAAAHALGKIGDTRSVEPLIALLEDGSQPRLVRCTAAVALSRMPDESATQALRRACESNDSKVSEVAKLSLDRQRHPVQVAD